MNNFYCHWGGGAGSQTLAFIEDSLRKEALTRFHCWSQKSKKAWAPPYFEGISLKGYGHSPLKTVKQRICTGHLKSRDFQHHSSCIVSRNLSSANVPVQPPIRCHLAPSWDARARAVGRRCHQKETAMIGLGPFLDKCWHTYPTIMIVWFDIWPTKKVPIVWTLDRCRLWRGFYDSWQLYINIKALILIFWESRLTNQYDEM